MSSLAIAKAPPAAAISAAVATAQIFPNVSSAVIPGVAAAVASACILNVPDANRLNSRRFEVRASGTCTTAGAYTVQAILYAAVVPPTGAASLVPANWTAVASGTATAVGTTTASWLIQCELIYDLTSGKLIGHFDSNVNNSYVAKAALSNPLTGLVGGTEPVFAFAVGLVFSTANASNIGVLTDFVLDA